MKQKLLKKIKSIPTLRLFWLSLIVIFVIVFLTLKIVPGGKITYRYNYAGKFHVGQGFIYNFTPPDRVVSKPGQLPKMIGDPLYFSVFTPRTFSKAKLKLYYRRNLDEKTPIIEAGILADGIVWRYDLKPIENRLIDNLYSSWRLLSSEPLIMQQDAYYQDQESFFSDLKAGNLKGCQTDRILECLAVYNYSPDLEVNFSFSESEKPFQLDVPLRGAHTLFLYPETDKLSFKVTVTDLNLDKNNDPIKLILSQGKKIIAQSDLADENRAPTGGQEEIKTLYLEDKIKAKELYKLEIKISDDVVIKKIESSTNRLVFANKLWPVSWGKELRVYTDSPYLQLKALGPASCQDFIFGQQSFSLSTPYEKQEFSLEQENGNKLKEIHLVRDDVIIETGGVFSFSRDNFFNPVVKKVDRYYQLRPENRYIIADYKGPQVYRGDILVNEAEFDLQGVYRENDKYNFVISVPGIEKNPANYLAIEKIEIEFSGRTLGQKLFNF
ncbi:MAG: hypothetical protein PWQ35_32 [Patescibacteria group bacterium]|nr:hypothetical protein [Patescibacteria group bacterium]